MRQFRWIDWNVNHAKRPWPKIVEGEKRIVWGQTAAGRMLQVAYVFDLDDTVFVIHAMDLPRQEAAVSPETTMSKAKIWYSRLPASELDKLAAGSDKPVDKSAMKPLSPTQRQQETRARRKLGRPRVGGGAEKLRISMERGLLKKVDAFAKKSGVSRSELIAESLRRTIGAA